MKRPSAATAGEAHRPPAAGVVRADAAYDLAEVRRRLGLGPAALRSARRRGLAVRRIGRKSFVLGSDLLDYLRDHAEIVV